MTHVKKLKWLISIFSLVGITAVSAPLIVSCSSSQNEPPKQEEQAPQPDPSIPEFDTLDQQIKWLWQDIIGAPINDYFNSNPNEELYIIIYNDSKPFNSLIIFNIHQFQNGNAYQQFVELMKESSIVGINYLQIINDKKGILIPGYENTPLYGPWGNPADKDWPSLLQAQLRWIRTK